MRVILDVNKPSSLSCGVQSCSSVEGFMEMKNLHPNDKFVIDPESYEAYETYMERLVMSEAQNFCDEMCINLEDLSAMIEWNSVKDSLLVAEYEFQQEEMYYAMFYDQKETELSCGQ